MPESTDQTPAPLNDQELNHANEGDPIMDPQNLVHRGGYVENPRELIETPGVAPEMLDGRNDLRSDLIEDETGGM